MSREELQAEYEKLRVETEHLQQENARLLTQLEEAQVLQQQYEQRLAEVQAENEELKRQLFGSRADRLSAEQQEQLKALGQDLDEQAGRPEPVSVEVLVEEPTAARPSRPRRVRHPLPAHLETETTTLEPELKPCPSCSELPHRIGEEVTEEIDLVPAKLIRRRIVRGKYACGCDEGGVAIAPLPPRLIPQSRLGLGLAVHIVLARFDDHLSFYRLEQQFRERHGVVIPRQQMVQWVEHIATWLLPLYEAVWKAMRAGGYLQVDETPVRVLDPEVEGKAARGYLWFYAVPGGCNLPRYFQQPLHFAVRDRSSAVSLLFVTPDPAVARTDACFSGVGHAAIRFEWS